MSIEETLEILPKENFIRIHRPFIIAKDRIEKAACHQVWINNVAVPAGKSYQENLNLSRK